MSKTEGSGALRQLVLIRRWSLFLPLLVAVTASSHAQEVTGLVVDANSSRPVADASVLLVENGGRVLSGVATDSSGSFFLNAPAAGSYTLRVDAEGYTTLVSPSFDVGTEVLEIELRIALQGVTELAPVTIEGEEMSLEPLPLRGGHERRRRGWGEFVTRQDMEEKMPMRFSDALRLTPGVKVIPMPVDIERPFGPWRRHHTIRIKGVATRSLYGDCIPVLYLDGTRMGKIDEATDGGPDLLVYPYDIEGIEVYRPSVVPAEFGGTDAMCGVIVVWTRRTP